MVPPYRELSSEHSWHKFGFNPTLASRSTRRPAMVQACRHSATAPSGGHVFSAVTTWGWVHTDAAKAGTFFEVPAFGIQRLVQSSAATLSSGI